MHGLQDDEVRQPLFIVSVTLLYSLLILNFIHIKYVLSVAAIFLLLSAIFGFIFKARNFLLVSMPVFVACFAFLFKFYTRDIIINSFKNKTLIIEGHIIDIPDYTDGICKYKVKVDRVKNVRNINYIPKFNLELISNDDINCDLFQKFVAKIKIYDSLNYRNDISLRSKNVALSGSILPHQKLERLEILKNIYYYIFKLKEYFVNFIDKALNPLCSSLIRALILGDKTKLDKNVKGYFSKSGVSHFLAISGFHVSIIGAMLINLFKLLKLNRKLSYILCCICIFIFIIMVGSTPSIIRAGTILIISLLSKLLFKPYNTLNSIGVSLIIILIHNLDSCFDLGLWMSFISSISISYFSKNALTIINNKIRIKNNIFFNYIISNLINSILGTISILPISILYFKSFSFIFTISNLLISFQIYLLIIFSLLSMFAFWISNLSFLSILPNFISKSLVIILKFLSKFHIDLNFDFNILIISFALIILSQLILAPNSKSKITSIFLILYIFVNIGILSYKIRSRNSYNLNVIGIKNQNIILENSKNNIIILNSEDIDMESNVLNKNMFIIRANNDSYDRNCDINMSDSYIYTLKIWDNIVKILTFNINGKYWFRINILGKIILLCNNGGDVYDLPEKIRKCDIFLALKLPNHFEILEFDQIIYANNSYFSKFNFGKISKYNNFISYGYNVKIQINSNKYNICRKV